MKIEDKISKMNDEGWTIPKETLLKEITEGSPLFKKLTLKILFNRQNIDKFLNPIQKFITQSISLEIPDIEEYNHLFLRPVPAQKLGKIWFQGTIVYVNAKEGSSQAMSLHVYHALNSYNVRIRKQGSEEIVSRNQALAMVKSGEVFCTMSDNIPTRQSEAVKSFVAPQ